MAVTNIPYQIGNYYGYRFDGKSNMCIKNGFEEFMGDKDFSIEIVVTPKNNQTETFFRNTTSSQGIMMQYVSQSKLIHIRYCSELIPEYKIYIPNVYINKTYQIILSYNSVTKERKVWCNGNFIGSYISSYYVLSSTPKNLYIGSTPTPSEFFTGSIHQIRIFNYVFEDSDVKKYWNNGKWNNVRISKDDYSITTKLNLLYSDYKILNKTGTGTENLLGILEKHNNYIDFYNNIVPENTADNAYPRLILSDKKDFQINKYIFKPGKYKFRSKFKIISGNIYSWGNSLGKYNGLDIYFSYPYNYGDNKNCQILSEKETISKEGIIEFERTVEWFNNDILPTNPARFTIALNCLELTKIRIYEYEYCKLGCVFELLPNTSYSDKWIESVNKKNLLVPEYKTDSRIVPETESPYYKDVLTDNKNPDMIPDFIGQKFINTVSKQIFTAMDNKLKTDWI